MSISLFAYVVFLQHYSLPKCPICHSNNILIDPFLNYKSFTCQACNFSYRDYFSFYYITPISSDLEITTNNYYDDID